MRWKNNKSAFSKSAVGILIFLKLGVSALATDGAANPTLFEQFFVAGGPIVWFILLPMSVAAMYCAGALLLTVQRRRLLSAQLPSQVLSFARQSGLTTLVERFKQRGDLVSQALCYALSRQSPPYDKTATAQYAAEGLQLAAHRLMRHMEWCQIIGTTAPMVGLFGTVLGMIRAFDILGISKGQPAYDQLASSISVALVTTFWGLLVAIPALAIYGIFRCRLEAIVRQAAVETDVLIEQLFQTVSAGWQPRITEPYGQAKPAE